MKDMIRNVKKMPMYESARWAVMRVAEGYRKNQAGPETIKRFLRAGITKVKVISRKWLKNWKKNSPNVTSFTKFGYA
ncbi:Hypothetical protein NTJ_09448 [Nesidiocoris tenuis]|uniref:Mos1 transposase HTH domain-containing protein n=1 Tax=Nesidiocoris tenuis TaxID=355587 RepID=A0ABN7AWS3_9HEMI|nr:Hypothetical protein NTJ_09448 [Nesidiocoris tenuis]